MSKAEDASKEWATLSDIERSPVSEETVQLERLAFVQGVK